MLACAVNGRGQTAPASATALSLQQVIDLVKAKNPSLLAAEQNLQAVKAQEIQAGVRTNPTFTLNGSDVSLPAQGASNPYTYSAQVSRLFELGQKRRWRLDVARSTTDLTAAQYRDQQRQIIFAVKAVFTSMVIAKAALKLAQDNLADFRHEVDINRDRFNAGDIGKLDFERLDLQLAQFESDEATAKVNVQQASYQLQTLAGVAQPSDTFDVFGDVVPPVVNETLTSLEQKALDTRPDYQASIAAVRVADATVKLTSANGLADPTLEGEYDRSGTYNSAGFSISIPLRLFDRNQGNKETARYQTQTVRFAQTAALNQLHSDVAQAWVAYRVAKGLSDRYHEHYLDESKDVLSIAQFAYDHGGLALIDYLDALRQSRATTSNALNSYAQTWMAIHQMSLATSTEIAP
ncbi:MAG: Cation efflux system protein CusA [Acidobacteriaceae bacterium]|nr:Cation efflux system protein CusA [Acidobacteriaceae bacterium]